MKTLFAVSFFFVFTASSYLFADEGKISGSIKTGVMSEYIGRVGSIFDDSPIMVNEVCLAYDDWYAGIWNSNGLSSHKYGTTYADEFDLYLGWTHTFDWVKVDVSSTYYFLSKLDKIGDDLWVFEPEISFPKFPFVQPYVRARYFGEVGPESPKGGMFYFAGLRKNIPVAESLFERKCMLNLDLSTAYAGGALHDFKGFVYGRLTASLDIPISEQWTFSPSIIYQVPVSGQRGNSQGFTDGYKFVFGFSLGYKF